MIVEFNVRGWWRANEAAGAAASVLAEDVPGGVALSVPFRAEIEAETADGVVRIITDDLTRDEIEVLRDYFENHPEQVLPAWERASLSAKEVRRQDRVKRARKVTDDTGVTVKTKDLKDAVRALAEEIGLEGGVDHG